jgi:hypothetical protein
MLLFIGSESIKQFVLINFGLELFSIVIHDFGAVLQSKQLHLIHIRVFGWIRDPLLIAEKLKFGLFRTHLQNLRQP